jgi:UPF0716 protein FxsA
MSFGKLILIGLLGLVVAEAGLFLLVAKAIGGFNALFLLLATSVLGGFILARMGRRLAATIAMAMARADSAAAPIAPGSFATMLGGLLLVLPGFLTDIAGLLLLIPPIQRRIAAAFPVRWTRQRDDIVDLKPEDWHNIPEARIEKQRREPPEP